MMLSISALIIIILLCIFILIKVFKEKSLANIQSRQTFSILLLWVILWSVSILITELYSSNLIVSLWASRFSFFTTALVGYWYYLFVKTYLKDEFNILGKIFWGLVAFFFTVISLTGKIVESVAYTKEGLQSVRGDFHLYFTIYTGIFFVYSASLFYTAFRKEQSLVTKSQIFYIFWGSILSICSSFVTNLVLPILGFKEIRVLGPLSLIFFILATYYAILRYRFPSTKMVISRLVYFLLISIIPYSIFHLVSYIQYELWGSIYTPEALTTGFIYSGIFIALFSFFSNRIEKVLKKIFSDYKVNVQEEKERLIRVYNDTLSVRDILLETQNLLKKLFHSEIKILIIDKGKIVEEFLEFGIEHLQERDILFLSDSKRVLILEELQHIENVAPLLEIFQRLNIRLVAPVRTSNITSWNVYIVIMDSSFKRIFSIQDLEHIRSVGSSMAIALQRAYLYLEVENFNESLKKKVGEQTEELQIKVQELQEARKKEADMIDIMGHELRTPATVVKLNVTLLEKYIKSNPEEFKKYLDRIKHAIETEIGLINTLLTSAKLEGNKVEIKHEKVDLEELIHMSVHGHEQEVNRKGIEIVSNIEKSLPKVYADKVRVAEVLDNLVSNAVKYTEKGGVKVIAKSDSQNVIVSVIDSGKGIPQNDIPKLGGKFFRVDNYLDSDIVRPGGTGLGLYITFKLIRLMGGDIKVDSNVNEGSIFTFTLPIYKGQVVHSSNSLDRFESLGLKR